MNAQHAARPLHEHARSRPRARRRSGRARGARSAGVGAALAARGVRRGADARVRVRDAPTRRRRASQRSWSIGWSKASSPCSTSRPRRRRRRRGHAARLIEHAILVARRAGCLRLLLEVRRSNQAAIRLYRKYGFRPIGVRAHYYANEHEDAIVMRLSLAPVPDAKIEPSCRERCPASFSSPPVAHR